MQQKVRNSRSRDRMGRPKVDPKLLRSYRFVMRMHQDLADALSLLADEASISRSLFTERVLISFVNQDPRFRLSQTGRRIPDTTPPGVGSGSFAELGARWRRFAALRHDVLGDDIMVAGDEALQQGNGPYEDESNYRRRQNVPPVPKHLLPPPLPETPKPRRNARPKKKR